MAEIPRNNPTFVFTDIQGSTALFRVLGNRYLDLLDRHNEIIRRAICDHAGYEVKTEGDAFFIAFDRAQDAVAAALQVQQEIIRNTWAALCSLRVRMGMHTGTAHIVDSDYVGLAVHTAARVVNAANGGQVLMTRATANLAQPFLPEGASLRNLGLHGLKDLPATHLFQLDHPDLDSEFSSAPQDAPSRRPLRAVGAPSPNLRAPTLPQAPNPALQARALLSVGRSARLRADYQLATSALTASLIECKAARPAVLHQLAELARVLGNPFLAERYLAMSMELMKERGDERGKALVLASMGTLALGRCEITKAKLILQQARLALKCVGDVTALSAVEINLGVACLLDGNHLAAAGLLYSAGERLAPAGNPFGVAIVQTNVGVALHEAGDTQGARRAWETAAGGFEVLGEKAGAVRAHLNLSCMARNQQSDQAAATYYLSRALALDPCLDRTAACAKVRPLPAPA